MNVDKQEEDMLDPVFVTELQILASSSWVFLATVTCGSWSCGSWYTPFVKESNEATLHNIIRCPLEVLTAEQHRAFARNEQLRRASRRVCR